MKAIILFLSLFWGQTLMAQQTTKPLFLTHLKNRPHIGRQDLNQDWQRNPDVIKQSLDSIVYQDWNDSANSWQNSWKPFFEYDNFGRITTITEFIWDHNNHVFKNFDKMQYQYNADGDMSRYLRQEWDASNQVWLNDQKSDYQYNNHLLVEKDVSQWDNNTATWELNYKYEYTYDNNGNLSYIIMYGNTVYRPSARNINSLQLQHKTTYAYDTQQHLIEKVRLDWDENSQDWQPDYKVTYSYTNDLLSEKVFLSWDETQQNWENNNKYIYTYNNNDLLTEVIDKEWYDTASQWVNSYQYEYHYDSYNNIVQEIDRTWVNNLWENEDRYDYAYDNSYVYDDLILPKYYYDDDIEEYMKSFFTHKLINGVEWTWDTSTNTWKTDMQYDLYFNPRNVSGVNDHNLAGVKLYPNPVDNLLVLNFDKKTNGKFELYNLTGQKLLSQPIQSTKQTIDLQQIPSGLYLYHIQTSDGLISGRLLKK